MLRLDLIVWGIFRSLLFFCQHCRADKQLSGLFLALRKRRRTLVAQLALKWMDWKASLITRHHYDLCHFHQC